MSLVMSAPGGPHGRCGTVQWLDSVVHVAVVTDALATLGLLWGMDPTSPRGSTPILQRWP